MKSVAKWMVRKAAEKLDAFDSGTLPALMRLGSAVYVKVPEAAAREVKLPTENPFTDEAELNYRRETAFMLLDDDVFGFLLLVFKPDSGEVGLRMQTLPEWMPLFQSAAAKVLQAA